MTRDEAIQNKSCNRCKHYKTSIYEGKTWEYCIHELNKCENLIDDDGITFYLGVKYDFYCKYFKPLK